MLDDTELLSHQLTGDVLFVTSRLCCRRWRESDLETIYAVYADPVGARWVDDGQPITHEESRGWLTVTARNYARRGYGMFALDELATGRTVGFCGLVHPDDQEDVEIKYAFLQSVWGQGLASEMVPALVAFGASTFSFAKVIATVAPENVASQRVLGKSGFTLTEVREDDDATQTLCFEWEPVS